MLMQRTARIFSSVNKKSTSSFRTNIRLYSKHYRNLLCFNQHKNQKHSYNHVPIRYLKTNVITPDNLVTSPYSDINVPSCLLHELIWENVEKWPDRVAIECGLTKRNYTFAQLHRYSKTFAASLLKSGIKPGDVISVLLPNLPEYPIVFMGASEAAVITSTVNPAYTADEICHQLYNSNSVCVVTYAAKLDTVYEAIRLLEKKKEAPVSLKIISLQNYDGVSRDCPSGVWSLEEMFQNNIDTSIVDSVNNQLNRKPEDIVLLPYSSGTTGLPKGVCLTHANMVTNVEQIGAKHCLMNMEPHGDFQDVIPVVLPIFHIYALVIMLLESLRHGGKLITLPKFDPIQYLQALNDYRSTIVFTVPPLVSFISSHAGVKKEMFEQTRHIMSAAAPIGQFDIDRCLKLFPKETVFKQGYGLTETSPIATMCPNDNPEPTSVGAGVPLTTLKIIDYNTGKSLGVREKGELLIRGPQVMKGYFNRPDATAETIDEDGWLHSGDIGYYDEKGFFYIVDRIKELIKVKGFQVAPAELEELLRSHPKVRDAAVIGVPDERAGETPIAYIVEQQGRGTANAEELISFVAGKVTKYKQITRVIFTDNIPKNPSGKILRRKLKNMHTSM